MDDALVNNMQHLFPTKVHKRKTGQLTAIFALSADEVQIIINVFSNLIGLNNLRSCRNKMWGPYLLLSWNSIFIVVSCFPCCTLPICISIYVQLS